MSALGLVPAPQTRASITSSKFRLLNQLRFELPLIRWDVAVAPSSRKFIVWPSACRICPRENFHLQFLWHMLYPVLHVLHLLMTIGPEHTQSAAQPSRRDRKNFTSYSLLRTICYYPQLSADGHRATRGGGAVAVTLQPCRAQAVGHPGPSVARTVTPNCTTRVRKWSPRLHKFQR